MVRSSIAVPLVMMDKMVQEGLSRPRSSIAISHLSGTSLEPWGLISSYSQANKDVLVTLLSMQGLISPDLKIISRFPVSPP